MNVTLNFPTLFNSLLMGILPLSHSKFQGTYQHIERLQLKIERQGRKGFCIVSCKPGLVPMSYFSMMVPGGIAALDFEYRLRKAQ